jgi:hypothetical protein
MNTRIVVVALGLAWAAPASAQWAIDASVGVVAPTSGSGFSAGLDVMGGVERRIVPVLPITLRAEIGWDRLGLAGYAVGAENITRVAIDAIVDPLIPGTRLRPYVLAGVGVYYVSLFSYHSTNPGINIGGGLRYPIGPIHAFVEVRYHIDYASAAAITFLPFQFGVRIPFP